MSVLDQNWYSEAFTSEGSAFSLKIKSKLETVKSPFQTIDMYETEHYGNLMVIDDCTMVSTRDNFLYHEMMSHVPLFSHPNPERVAIIGGGDCGTLREVLKHPGVKQIWQVDIDEMVTRMSEKYFPELCESNDDPRATLLFDDGIRFIAEAKPGSFDVIIIDSTDPVGPAEGLFAVDFYKNCEKALSADGLVVQQSESPLYHTHSIIKKVHDDMKSAGFASCHTFPFPQPLYPSGWWSCTLAKKSGQATAFREADAANKTFKTQYYNVDMHKAGLAMPEFMKQALNQD